MTETAFITGASGFIGTQLAEELSRRGWHLRLLQHRSKLFWDQPHEIVKGDLAAPDSYRGALDGTDVVFHLAAALGASLQNEDGFRRINTAGTANLLEAARKAGVRRFIHFSSAGVLGHVAGGEPADESTPCLPQNVYDRTKLEAEEEALAAARKGQNVVIIRPGWVYGPADRRTFKLIRAIARKRFILVTRGRARQTPVFVRDLILGVLLCLSRGRPGEIYHLAGDEVLTVRQMVETMASALDTGIPRLHLPLFPARIAARVLESSFRLIKREAPLTTGKLAFFIHPKPLAIQKARDECGFAPHTDFTTGMEQTVTWYRQNNWL